MADTTYTTNCSRRGDERRLVATHSTVTFEGHGGQLRIAKASMSSSGSAPLSSAEVALKRSRADATGADTSDASDAWPCGRCTFRNHSALSVCEICDAGRPTAASLTQSPSQSPSKRPRLTRNSNKDGASPPPAHATHAAAATTTHTTPDGRLVFDLDADDDAAVTAAPAPAAFDRDSVVNRFLLAAIGDVLRAEGRAHRLCHPPAHHITQLNQYGAQWSCGYRNLQMLCSSLVQLPAYRRALFHGAFAHIADPAEAAAAVRAMPIATLQRWIERAWQAGFDVAGAADFDFCLEGKDDWIGTTEVAALLRFFGLRALIVDFHCREAPPPRAKSTGLRPARPPPLPPRGRRRSAAAPPAAHDMGRRLALFAHRYFARAPDASDAPEATARPPLYFQYNGHSRSIVGVEYARADGGVAAATVDGDVPWLLVFDPISRSNALQQHLLGRAAISRRWQRMVKKAPRSLRRYAPHQICFVAPGLVAPTSAEYAAGQTLRSALDGDLLAAPDAAWPATLFAPP
eukprot:gene11942-8525_t